MPDVTTKTPPAREPVEFTYAPPARRPVRRRIGWALRSWARDTFSRESMVSSLKSLAWVAPLTVLIWVYAEREQDAVLKGVPVAIEVRSGEPGRVVKLAETAGSTIHVDLQGPQAGIEHVKDWLASATIPIDIPQNLSPGEHPVPLLNQLNALPQMKNNGVTLTNSMPAEAAVDVDLIGHIDVEVKAHAEDEKALGAPPVFNPAKVRVVGPQRVLDAAIAQSGQQNRPLIAYANLSSFKPQLIEPGKHSLSGVPVTLSVPISDPKVQIVPGSVSADVEVTDKAERTETLQYLRVLAAYRPDSGAKADQYKVFYDPTITNVTVTGPEQQLALLHDPTYLQNHAPAAIFEVNFNDTDNPAPAPILYQLPPGVHVSDADAQRKITYSFRPRTTEPQ